MERYNNSRIQIRASLYDTDLQLTFWKLMFIYSINKDSVRTSQRTQSVDIRNPPNGLMMVILMAWWWFIFGAETSRQDNVYNIACCVWLIAKQAYI